MVIATKYVVTRKEHKCWGCGVKFPTKSFMVVTTAINDGEISSTYWCEPCNLFINEHSEDFEEGIAFGEFKGEEVYEEFVKQYRE